MKAGRLRVRKARYLPSLLAYDSTHGSGSCVCSESASVTARLRSPLAISVDLCRSVLVGTVEPSAVEPKAAWFKENQTSRNCDLTETSRQTSRPLSPVRDSLRRPMELRRATTIEGAATVDGGDSCRSAHQNETRSCAGHIDAGLSEDPAQSSHRLSTRHCVLYPLLLVCSRIGAHAGRKNRSMTNPIRSHSHRSKSFVFPLVAAVHTNPFVVAAVCASQHKILQPDAVGYGIVWPCYGSLALLGYLP